MSDRTIKYYRMQGGVKTPYKMTLTSDMIMVSDIVDAAAQKRMMTSPYAQIQNGPGETPLAVKARMAQSGIDVEFHDGKEVHILRRPQVRDLTFGRWFLPAIYDNPFPGTDELRAQYAKERQALEAKYSTQGLKCPNCEESTLLKKFRDQVEKILPEDFDYASAYGQHP